MVANIRQVRRARRLGEVAKLAPIDTGYQAVFSYAQRAGWLESEEQGRCAGRGVRADTRSTAARIGAGGVPPGLAGEFAEYILH